MDQATQATAPTTATEAQPSAPIEAATGSATETTAPPDTAAEQQQAQPTALDMARLLKAEQRLQRKRAEEKAAIERERAEYQSKYQRYVEAEQETSLAKRLEKLGIDYTEVTKELLSSDPSSKVAMEVAELKAQLAEREKREQEAREQASKATQQARVIEAQHAIAKELEADPELELVRAFGMAGTIAQQTTARVMAGERDLTAQSIARDYEKQVEAALKAALSTEKGRRLMAQLKPETANGATRQAAMAPSATLSNALSSARGGDPKRETRVKSFLEADAEIARNVLSKLGR